MKIINDIWNEIKKHQKIVCLGHIIPDGDSYSSQIGLSLLIKKSFPNKQVMCCNDASTRFASWNQYLENEKAAFIKDSLVIICDTAIASRINSQFYFLAKTIIKIDHHPVTDLYGQINWIDEKASSASQMIAMLSSHLKLDIDSNIAQILYTGIISDTNRFHYPTVDTNTFSILSYLTSFKFDLAKIYNQYYQQTVTTLQLKSMILENYEITNNKVLSYCLEGKICQSLNITAQQANEEVDLLANIDDAKIWMMFSQSVVDGPIIGVFRSNKFKVNGIAKKFGGGGHVHYAGGTFQSWKQVREIIKAYDQLVA